jgi:hypothetical protein
MYTVEDVVVLIEFAIKLQFPHSFTCGAKHDPQLGHFHPNMGYLLGF